MKRADRGFRKPTMPLALRRRNVLIGGALISALLLISALAPLLAPVDPLEQNLRHAFQSPSRDYPFGTDQYGRCILSRVIHGARISLVEVSVAVGMAMGIGVPLGLTAGYFGGRTDQLIMWTLDIIFAFPGMLLAILIVSVLGPSLFNMLIAIAIFSIPVYGRLCRNLTLNIKQMEYVEAALAIGAKSYYIIFRHILRNAVAPLLVQATLTAGGVILTAASLSFLGLGVRPPTPEWGAMISTGRSYITIAPHLSLFPGLAILFTVLGFNLLGDGLRDLLDPRLRGS